MATKSATILIFITLVGLPLIYQNCGKNNPATTHGALIEELGSELEGKSFFLYRVEYPDGSSVQVNQSDVDQVNIHIRFEEDDTISGSDGCNNFNGHVIWLIDSATQLKQFQAYDVLSTLMACEDNDVDVEFPVDSYYYEVVDDTLKLVSVKTNILYEFAELQEL